MNPYLMTFEEFEALSGEAPEVEESGRLDGGKLHFITVRTRSKCLSYAFLDAQGQRQLKLDSMAFRLLDIITKQNGPTIVYERNA